MAILIKLKAKYRRIKPGSDGSYSPRTQSGTGQHKQTKLNFTNKKLIRYVKKANLWCLTWFEKGTQKQKFNKSKQELLKE